MGIEIRASKELIEEIKKLEKLRDNKYTPAPMRQKYQEKIDALKEKQLYDSEPDSKKASKKPKRKAGANADKGKERFKLAKEIRKPGESWPDAMRRAAKRQRGESDEPKKPVKKIKRAEKKTTPVKKAKKIVRKAKLAPVKNKKKIVRMVGTSARGKDKQIKAKKPGIRRSSTGQIYYETRRNRADADPKKKL